MDQHLTAQAGEDGTVATRLLQGCLPPGWHLLGRARHGNRAPGAAPSGCHLLAHEDRGVALLDIAPDATPNAEARLRRALAATGFARAFPGRLPVWHERLELAQLPRLGTLLARAFETLPPLTLPQGGAWLAAVEAAIASDPAWAPAASAAAPAGEAPLPAPAPIPDPWPAVVPRPRRGLRAGLLAAGLILIFGLGWAMGRLLPFWGEGPAEPGLAEETEATPAAPAIPAQPAGPEPPPQRSPTAPETDTAGRAAETPGSLAAQARALAEPALQAAPAVAQPAAEAAPPPPPEPIATPPPRAVRPRAPAYDRACGEAQFRWQRGEALTAAEMAHISNGCGPARLR